MRGSTGRRLFTAFAALALAISGAVWWTLDRRSDPSGTVLDRTAELWAHKALMDARNGQTLAQFSTDGCSGGMSALWRQLSADFPTLADIAGTHPPWEECCIAHDRTYFSAGNATTAEESFEARRVADNALYQCIVKSDPANGPIADAMYLAVRAGGGPCTGLNWRWGYGLPGCLPLINGVDSQE